MSDIFVCTLVDQLYYNENVCKTLYINTFRNNFGKSQGGDLNAHMQKQAHS